MNIKMNEKSYSERFTYEELEKILQKVQYEIDKLYGDGMFKVIYNDSHQEGFSYNMCYEDDVYSVATKLNEQQATIRRLQDLCGKSDGENMKLRIENKRLQEELNDCEKFRYTVFKRLNDEIKLLKPTNIEQYEQIQKLQEENEQLQAQLREKEQDEQLYANEIVKLNKEAKEVLDFKSLGGDY